MANTYTLLSSNTLGSNAASVSFSSIPANYTDIVIRFSVRTTSVSTDSIRYTINSDSNTNYNFLTLYGNGSSAVSAGEQNYTVAGRYFYSAVDSGATSNTFSNGEICFFNYLSDKNKTILERGVNENNAADALESLGSTLYVSTTPINTITLSSWNAGDFIAGSTFYLYGVWDNAATTKPSTPTIGTATDAGTGTGALVAFTPTSATGVDASYTALSTPGSITAVGIASPITVTGLTTGTAYTFQVRANNPGGSSAYSAASNSVTVANPPGWSSIATATGAGNPSTITFNSIPQGYTDLQIRGINANTGASLQHLYLTFNGDTTSSYYFSSLYGAGTSASANGGASSAIELTNSVLSTSQNSMYSPCVIDIIDYASGKKPTVHFEYTTDANIVSGSYRIAQGSGIWNNTNAITSITLQPSGGSFNTYTEFALYGLKASA